MASTMRRVTVDGQSLRRQYSLADLFTFLLAGSVYFAMIASLGPVFNRIGGGEDWWPMLVTVPTAWCVLLLLYRRWRLPHALTVHYSGPVLAFTLLLLVSSSALIDWAFAMPLRGFPAEYFLSGVVVAALAGFGMSSAVSLPAAAVMLLYLCTLPGEAERR